RLGRLQSPERLLHDPIVARVALRSRDGRLQSLDLRLRREDGLLDVLELLAFVPGQPPRLGLDLLAARLGLLCRRLRRTRLRPLLPVEQVVLVVARQLDRPPAP